MANHTLVFLPGKCHGLRKPRWAIIHGVTKVKSDWETKQTNSFSFCQYEQLTPVINFLESIFPQNTNVFYCLTPCLFYTPTSLVSSIECKPLSSCLVTVDAMGLFPRVLKTETPTTGTNMSNLPVSDASSSCSCDIFIWCEMGLLKSRCSHPLTSTTTSGTM